MNKRTQNLDRQNGIILEKKNSHADQKARQSLLFGIFFSLLAGPKNKSNQAPSTPQMKHSEKCDGKAGVDRLVNDSSVQSGDKMDALSP